MRRAFAIVTVLSIILSVFAVTPAFAEDKDFAKVDFTGTDETYSSGSIVNVVVSLSDITLGDDDGVSAFTFRFYYDAEKVSPNALPTIDADGDAFNFSHIVNTAPTGWDALGKLDTKTGCYELVFGEYTGESLVTNDNRLVFTLPFTVKNETKVDDIVFSMREIEIYNSTLQKSYAPADVDIAMSYAIQPDELVSLPEGAISVDMAGYQDGENVVYYASEETTVGEYLGKFDADADMSDYGIVIVDENGEVTYADVSNSDKSSVVIPQGSYILGVNSENTSDFDALSAVATKGARVTLYNLNVEATAKVTVATPVEQVGFTVEAPSIKVKEGALIKYDEENAILRVYPDMSDSNGGLIDIAAFKTMFEYEITVLDKNGNVVTEGLVKTGMTVDYGEGVTVLIMGDVDCNGKVNAFDYVAVKRHIIRTLILTGPGYTAACITGRAVPSPTDYLALKRHVVRTLSVSAYFKP